MSSLLQITNERDEEEMAEKAEDAEDADSEALEGELECVTVLNLF